MADSFSFPDVLSWATTALEQVALTDRVTGDRPDADADARRDRALATVLLEVIVAQASARGLGPSAAARRTIAAMLGVLGARPDVDVPPFVAEADLPVMGAIHEALLGLVLDDDVLRGPDGKRKGGGAYYTPASAVDVLLGHTLAPVLDRESSLEEVGRVRVCDPACGGGNFLDRAAVMIANRLTSLGMDANVARRTAASCMTGVDIDPVAVVLARIGLWLRVADPELPPTFFSAHVVLGDALAGSRPGEALELPLAAFEPGADDDRRTATIWRKAFVAALHEDPSLVDKAVAADPHLALDAMALLWQAPKVPDARNPADVLIALGRGLAPIAADVQLVGRLSRRHRPLHWPLDVPASLAGFDVIVGNPPYVKSRAHGRTHPALRRRLTRTRPECRGGQWNLYVPFVALAADLLRDGGRSALLVPNSVVAADFARPLHAHVVDRVVEVLDFTRADLFDQAAVHVASLVTGHEPCDLPIRFVVHDAALNVVANDEVDRGLLDRLPPGYWCLPILAPDLDVPHERLMALLGSPKTIADVGVARDGASTSEAYELKALVRELRDGEDLDDGTLLRFANTGTIDPDNFQWGTRPTVYLGEKPLRPVVERAALAADFPKRAIEADTPKVLLAGLSARLEAVADPGGNWLCGKSAVQVLVAEPHEAIRLAAWLNEPEISALYRALFGLAGFGGKGMNVAPALVGRLPAPPDDWSAPATKKTGAAHTENTQQ